MLQGCAHRRESNVVAEGVAENRPNEVSCVEREGDSEKKNPAPSEEQREKQAFPRWKSHHPAMSGGPIMPSVKPNEEFELGGGREK